MLAQEPPIRVIAPGRTYRADYDATHSPMFHQCEGIVIDRHITLAHLKGCLIDFLRAFFGISTLPVRFRSSYFPFTEPSMEVDIGWNKRTGEIGGGTANAAHDWLEILGSGMVHPRVLANCGLDPREWQGFAFGMGIERDRDAEARHPRPPPVLRERPALAAAFRLQRAVAGPAARGSRLMKFTLSWLRTHLDTDATLDEITDKLTGIGLELESVTDPGEALRPFRVGYVIEAKQHPNADRLRACTVDAGDGPVSVVCGAPNARTGLKIVFAPPGSYIPGTGVTLKVGEIRGVVSAGMMLSRREMGLGEDHDGIVELPEDAPIGVSYPDYAGLDDPVIDIAITPNRGDALSVRGVARDLAAAGLGRLKPWAPLPVTGRFDSPLTWAIEDHEACPWVVGRTIRGLTNGPSPAWLQSPADQHRPPPHQRSRGRHELLHRRSRPPAPRVRRRPRARRRAHLPATAPARAFLEPSTAANTPPTPADCVIADSGRRAVPRRGDGRRSDRLHRGDHRRVRRVRLVRPGARRTHRPPPRHRVRRPATVRARHRPGAPAGCARGGHAHDPVVLRR